MVYKILITPDAQKQVEEVVEYYKEKASPKVAANFLKDYKNTINEILKVRYFQLFFLDFRARVMNKFPYLIFYTIDETQQLIIIKAVFHTSQDTIKYPK